MSFCKLYLIISFFSLFAIQAQEHSFSDEALNDTLINLEGEDVTFNSIIEENIGNVVLIDIWATWCKDCIVGMPIVNKLKKDYPNVVFVYISLDRDESSWKQGIKRFKIENGSHFWAVDGWKSELFQSIDLDWIP